MPPSGGARAPCGRKQDSGTHEHGPRSLVERLRSLRLGKPWRKPRREVGVKAEPEQFEHDGGAAEHQELRAFGSEASWLLASSKDAWFKRRRPGLLFRLLDITRLVNGRAPSSARVSPWHSRRRGLA